MKKMSMKYLILNFAPIQHIGSNRSPDETSVDRGATLSDETSIDGGAMLSNLGYSNSTCVLYCNFPQQNYFSYANLL